jgi:regulator of sigma E protease
MSTVLVLVIVLSILVFVHEFGHFSMAKLFKAKVEEFGFGFPPRIFGIKKGDTIYSINWIPLGGFVKIQGESGTDAHDPKSFASKPVWQRGIILTAGVIMNLVLAWILLTIGYTAGLPAAIDDEMPSYAKVSQAKIQVLSVLPDSSADLAGLETGDTILALDGTPPTDIDAFREYTGSRGGETIALTYSRIGGEPQEINLMPREMEEIGRVGLGVAIIQTGVVSYPIWLAPIQAAGAVTYFVREIFSAFGGLIRDAVLGKPVGVEFSGPVGIAVITAEVTRMGFRYLLQFTALLSVNLAVINILPFPALDGGRILFLAIEKIRRRAVSPKIEAAVHNFGFALLMLLVLMVTYRDIVNFGDRIKQAFGG